MSVYKPGKGRYWHYDFVFQRRRYTGSTGATTESKAKVAEARKREAAGRGELDRPARDIQTLGQAATTWWTTKSDKKSADQLLVRVTLAVELVGRNKPVNEVTFADIAAAIQKRRGRLVRGKTVPANATINRDLIATLRPTIALARELLNDGRSPVPFPEIRWGKLALKEPAPKPKGLSGRDVEAIIAALPDHLHDFVRFQARYGCRIGEMFFHPNAVDVEGERLTLRDRKAGDDHVVPVMPEDVAMLAARISRAQKAGLDTVWYREVKGRLIARTPRGVGKALMQAMTDTGLRETKGARGSHSLRHTAGMDMLRGTGNVRAAQKLLGHASINSTMVYAHVLEDDLRAALASLSRPAHKQPVLDEDENSAMLLKEKAK